MVTATDEQERDSFYRSLPMTKQEKLEEIRRMRSELRGEAEKENEAQ
jgi:hypothetical protein